MEATTLDSQVEKSLGQQKMITTPCGTFGLFALALTLVGIYGMTAYSVAGRTNEIGIRMAIGAQRQAVIWLVLRGTLITAGLVAGLPLAFAATRWLKSFLFGIQSVDLLANGSALQLLIGLAMLAGFLPAQRAARIDPMRALRHE